MGPLWSTRMVILTLLFIPATHTRYFKMFLMYFNQICNFFFVLFIVQWNGGKKKLNFSYFDLDLSQCTLECTDTTLLSKVGSDTVIQGKMHRYYVLVCGERNHARCSSKRAWIYLASKMRSERERETNDWGDRTHILPIMNCFWCQDYLHAGLHVNYHIVRLNWMWHFHMII